MWTSGRGRVALVGPVWRRMMPRIVESETDAALRRAAERRDWAAVRDGLLAEPEGDRGTRIGRLGQAQALRAWGTEIVESERRGGGHLALALTAAGADHIHWGWEARTAARAKYVSAEQFRTFHERLRTAEEYLYEAAELAPESAEPWFFLIVSGMGLQVGRSAARHRFEAVVRRVPEHLGAHKSYLQQVCAKWGGSDEEMHAFAYGAMTAAPEGSPLAALVPAAHVEAWLEADGTGPSYFQRTEVRRPILAAAERSVFHPAYRKGVDWVWEHNMFAMTLALAGEDKAARRVFRALGGRMTEAPWHYLRGKPQDAYRRLRRRTAGWI